MLAEITQGLNNQSTDPARRGHITRSRALQDDLLPAKLDMTRGAVCQEYHLHRYLIRKTEDVRGIAAGRLKTDSVTTRKRLGYGVYRGS